MKMDTIKPFLLLFTVLNDTVYISSTNLSKQTTVKSWSSSQLQSERNVSAESTVFSQGNMNMSFDVEKDHKEGLSVFEEPDLSTFVKGTTNSGNRYEKTTFHSILGLPVSPAASNSTLKRTNRHSQTPLLSPSSKTSTETFIKTKQSYDQRVNDRTEFFYSSTQYDKSTTVFDEFTPWFTSTPGFIIKKWMDPTELCDEMVSYVEKYKLCTCKDRCGENELRTGPGTCFCDDLCSTYNDCCHDFNFYCPDMYVRSQNILEYEVVSTCFAGNRVIISCPYEPDSQPVMASTEIMSSTSPVSESPSGLMTHHNNVHYVADLLTGLVYWDENIYMCNKGENSVPYLTPYVLPPSGLYKYNQSIESYVFPKTSYSDIAYPVASTKIQIQGCSEEEYILCDQCSSGVEKFHLQAVCRALVSKNDTGMRNPPLNTDSNRLASKGMCYYGRGRITDSRKNQPKHVDISVTIQRVSIFSKEYVLDFEGVPWKRMRCSSPELLLDDCDIAECSTGFWPGDEGGCFIPDIITVKFSHTTVIPICSCLMAYSAIEGTKIWELTKVKPRDDTCQIYIQGNSDSNIGLSDGHGRNISYSAAREAIKNEYIQKLDNCDDVGLYSTVTLRFGQSAHFRKHSFYFNISMTHEGPAQTTSHSGGSSGQNPAVFSETVSKVQHSSTYGTLLAVAVASYATTRAFL